MHWGFDLKENEWCICNQSFFLLLLFPGGGGGAETRQLL